MDGIAFPTLKELASKELAAGSTQVTKREIQTIYHRAQATLRTVAPDAHGVRTLRLTRANGRPVIVKVFSPDAYNGPRKENYLARAQLAVKAGCHYLALHTCEYAAAQEKLKNLLADFQQTLDKDSELQFCMDKMRKGGQCLAAEFHRKHPAIKKELAKLYKAVQESIDDALSEQPFGIGDLVEAEKSYLSDYGNPQYGYTGRQDIMHIWHAAGHSIVDGYFGIGKQIPSSVRNDPDCTSNHVLSYCASKTAHDPLRMRFLGRRHASAPAIALPKQAERRTAAFEVIRRDIIDTVRLQVERGAKGGASPESPLSVRLPVMSLLTPLKGENFVRNRRHGKWVGESERMQFKEEYLAVRAFQGRLMQVTVGDKKLWIRVETRLMNRGANPEALRFHKFASALQKRANRRGILELGNDVYQALKQGRHLKNRYVAAAVSLMQLKAARPGISAQDCAKQDEIESKLRSLYEGLERATETATSDDSCAKKLAKAIKSEIYELERQLTPLYCTQVKSRRKAFKHYQQEILENVQHSNGNAYAILVQAYRAFDSYYNKVYRQPGRIMDFQAAYIRCYYALGDIPLYHCKSAEDRTGNTQDHIEGSIVFELINGGHVATHPVELLWQRRLAAQYSPYMISTAITNECCPGAEGEQIKDKVNPERRTHGVPASVSLEMAKLHKEVPLMAKKE